MELSAINLEGFYNSLRGIIEPPLQQAHEVEEEPIVLVAVKEACYWFAKTLGWTFKGDIPPHIKKGVIVIAPHTSKLDLIFGMAAYRCLKNVRGHYLAKKELFSGPMRFIFENSGGIPVNRYEDKKIIETVSKFFDERETFFLTLAPEGTRSYTKKWKTGFYRIALNADVPIILGYLDFEKKEAGVGDIIYPSGDYEADAKKIEAFYKNVTPFWKKKWNWNVL